MPIGTCRLCLEQKDLLKSHFMPAALYPKHVKKKMEFAMRGGKVMTDGLEMTARALCSDCERRLDEGGESEVLAAIAPKLTKRFPLHERMQLAVPRDEFGGAARFAGYELGLDMDKFAYFAMSIVWRRAAIEWTAFDSSILPGTPLGTFEEQIRQYLLRPAKLPPDMVVIVLVDSSKEMRRVWMPPTQEVFDSCLNFRFMVRGIFFRVLMGRGMPAHYRDKCCTSPRKCIFYGDGSDRAPAIMRIFNESGRSRQGKSSVE